MGSAPRLSGSRLAVPGWLAVVLLLSFDARAGDLRIETIEHGTWPAAVASLQLDAKSEGRSIRVVVKDDIGQRLLCGTYSLELGGAGADAFVVGACDESTNATPVRLLHRSALFDHDDNVARPRAPRISATRVQSGSAAGGAKQSAGTFVSCIADVHPFLDDMEKGERVALTPGRYELLADGDVEVKPLDAGWRIFAHGPANPRIAYRIIDGRRNEVVFRDHVTVNCSGEATAVVAEPMSAGSAGPERIVRQPASGVIGTTTDAEPAHDAAPARAGWDGNAWTITATAGTAYLRPSGLAFGNGRDTQDASLFGLRDVAAPVFGLFGAYERTGLYSSFGAHVAWVNVSDRHLFHYGIGSVVAAALHLGDVTVYLGPNVEFGSYQLTGVGPQTWGTQGGFSIGAASGVRLHLRTDDGKAWVLGGELIAPVAGTEPWFFVASIGWGGAN